MEVKKLKFNNMSHLSKERYGYFDALRGFSMAVVVFWHISLFDFDLTFSWSVNRFFYSFMTPLFFFISGFFAHKPLKSWNRHKIKDIVTRKFKVQIIGATIFHCLFIIFILNQLPVEYDILDPERYWFTYTLFRIFILYIAIVLISKTAKHSEKLFWILLVLATAGSIGIFANYFDFIKLIRWSNLSEAILYQLIHRLDVYWFPYFAFGILFRAKLGMFENILSRDAARAIIMIANIIIWSLISLGYPLEFSYTISSYPIRLISMILVLQFFYSIRSKFDTNSFFSRAFRLVGRRTLDIYFIHYFFLSDLGFLRPYLGHDPVVLIVVIMTFTLIIMGLSLAVGQVIRMSPTMAEWLLGVRKNERR